MLASDKELLRHIQEELHFILHYTNDKTKEEMVNDPVLRRAIIRSLEIIGEAAKKGLRINLLRPCAQYPAKGGILPKPPIIFDSFLPTIP
ncbi:MAG: DUF86 domain-containing protein [Bacteroidota bacterium]|nr:DUF86 domain-containing protein [Bacteroidota bacterium]